MGLKFLMNYTNQLSSCLAGLLLVFASQIVLAQSDQRGKLVITFQPGYFQEDFRWSIAGDSQGKNPNIYSELRWKNLSGPQFALDVKYKFWKALVLQVNFSESFITSGTVTDTDFGQDNRKDTLYHDQFDSNKGSVTAFHATIGYQLKIKRFSITPFAGYVVNAQSLYLLKDFGNVIGDLRSTYKTRWQGFTAGFNIRIPVGKKFTIEPSFVYNQTNYSSKANWNLIENFKHPVSFRHKAVGFGLEPSLNVRYMIRKKLSFLIGGYYSYWTTGKGSDRLYLMDGQIPVTQFNGAHRSSLGISLGVSYSFF
jgi:hypothetical protein